MISLEELISRATADRMPDRDKDFTPSHVYQVLEDPFWLWCHYHASKEGAVDEISTYDRLQMQRGREHEEKWVKEKYPNAKRIPPGDPIQTLHQTLKAMLEGIPVIHGAQLWDLGNEVYGQGDLLVRDNGHTSLLGPYHYQVVEIKNAKNVKEHHTLQAALYNRVLGHIQNFLPETFSVALKDDLIHTLYKDVECDTDDILSYWRDIRDGKAEPDPAGLDATASPWRLYGNQLILEREDLILLPDVGPKARMKLIDALGVKRIRDLEPFALEQLQDILGENKGERAYHCVRAYLTKKAIPNTASPYKVSRGKRNLYFDFETSDDVHATELPHIYLIGLWDKEKDRYEHFLAKGERDEERILKEFLCYVEECPVQDSRLYHWAKFEIDQMKKAAEKYPTLQNRIAAIIKRCVDLKTLVKESFYLPVPTYSIKAVAPFLGFQWRQKGVGAFESMTWYWDSLDGGNPEAVKKAVMYNEDDCRAMLAVDQAVSLS